MKVITVICLLVVFSTSSPTLAGVWRDGFNDGNYDGWEPYNFTPPVKCGEWSVKDGVLHYEAPGIRSICAMTFGEDDWRDYTIIFKARMLKKLLPDVGRIWIAVRMRRAPSTFHIYCLYGPIFGVTTAGIGVFTGSGGAESFVVPPFVPEIEYGRWYGMKVEVKGDKCMFYIDDKLMVQYTILSGYESGKFGLGALFAHVEFDDVTVIGPDVPNSEEVTSVRVSEKLPIIWAELKR